MNRSAFVHLDRWFRSTSRKPLVLRGARQVGKSYLVREFCQRKKLTCLEINFERDPSLRKLFIEGENKKTTRLLEVHFGKKLDPSTLLFLDEIQSAPEVYSRLRYFHEETPEISVIAAGSLLEFALAELEHSMPVGRIEYLQLGPMRFEEFLEALGEDSLLGQIRQYEKDPIPEIFHQRLLGLVRDFSLVGGMPEVVSRYSVDRDLLACSHLQRGIIDTYRQDFSKYRKRVPLDRVERVFDAIPMNVGRKWVHARVNPGEKAGQTEAALEMLLRARVAHRVFHSSGNGVPLSAEKKERSSKVLFLDVGLMGAQQGLRLTDLIQPESFTRVNAGSIAEQWVGQHLLDLRPYSQSPELFYWVREKRGSLAEIDYLWAAGSRIIPIEVKAGSSARAKSLSVFLSEHSKSPLAIQYSMAPAEWDAARKILRLPFYLIEQTERILETELRNRRDAGHFCDS